MLTKAFNDIVLREFVRKDGQTRWLVDYGPSLGSQIFRSQESALNELDGWSDDEIGRLSKQLAGLTKLRRYIHKTR